MSKSIVLFCTVDTKAEQILFLKKRIVSKGCRPIIFDLSMGEIENQFADITSNELLLSSGVDPKLVRNSKDRGKISEIMVQSAKNRLKTLIDKEEIGCFAAMGGVSMASMASQLMQEIPFGIPKAILITAAMPSYISKWFDAMDILIFQGIIEFSGMNEIIKNVLDRFAGAVCGMCEVQRFDFSSLPYPSVAITELGFSQKCAHNVQRLLREKGFHVYSFHAQGISDRTMEKLLKQGCFHGVIDIATAGLIEELFGGTRAAGMERLDYLSHRSMPVVLAPAALNITNIKHGAIKNKKQKPVLKVDSLRAYVRYSKGQLKNASKLYAEKLNSAKSSVVFLFPTKGLSSLDSKGSILFNPEEDKIFINEIRKRLKNPNVLIKEIDCNLEDSQFAEALIQEFFMLQKNLPT